MRLLRNSILALPLLLAACAGSGEGSCNCPEPAEIVIPHGTGEWLDMATGPEDSLMKIIGQGAVIRDNEWRRANGLPEIELPEEQKE